MKRLLANSLMLVGGMTLSSQLLALGLGELNLKSALNQPLQAEIELIDADGLTQWEIKPSLASAADFERAGVDRLFFFSNMTFRVEGNRILVTSREPVTEPFLNFLVEVNWPAGRMLREYTLLLDPPTFDEPQFQPLVSTPATTVSESELTARPAPVVAPVEVAAANPWLDDPAAPGTYKVQKDDTLWEIALQTRPDSRVSVQQMMLAIQQENPNAFIGGNINRLKTHQVLNIPDAQTVQRMNQSQAIAEVARQNRALTAGAAQIDATGRNTAGVASSAAQTGGEVRLVAPAQTQADAASASGDVAAQSGSGREQALENDLAISLENLDKARLENQELRERLESLEEQINTLQRLLTLKDDQLALIQTHDRAADAAVMEQQDLASATLEDADIAQAEGDSAADFNYQPSAPAVADEETVEQRRERMAALLAAQEAAEQANKKSPVDALLQRPEWLGGLAALLVLLGALAYRLVKRRGVKEEDDIESLTNVEAPVFAENDSQLDDFDFDHDDVLVKDDAQSGDDFSDIELDGLDEEDDSTVAQTDDVISESDIYIAYGKFEQAIALLSNAIAAEPSRSDLRLKLLEVYVEMDDGDAFAIAESDLQTLGDRQADQQAQSMRQRLSSPVAPTAPVVSNAMASDDGLSLDSEIPSLTDDLGSEFDDGLDFGDALDLDDSDDLPVLTESDDLTSLDSTASSLDDVPTLDVDEPINDALDFSLDDGDDLANSSDEVTDSLEAVLDLDNEVSTSDDIEFDLSQFDAVESDLTKTSEDTVSAAVEEDDYALAFDLSDAASNSSDDTINAPAAVDVEQEPAAESSLDEELSFDEDDFDLDDDINDTTDSAPAEPSDLDALESLLDGESEGETNLTDLSFDIEETGFADTSDSLDDLSALDAELSSSVSSIDALAADGNDVISPAEVTSATDMTNEIAEEQEEAFSFDELDALADNENTSVVSEAVVADDETLDFAADLAELDSELGDFDESDLVSEAVDSSPSASDSPTDQSIDLDALAEADDEFDYLAGTDECATKLDLARAYIDMEDADGARELLQEVLQEGNDQQKQEARSLMDDLA